MLKNSFLIRLGLSLTVFIIDALVWGGDTETIMGTTVPIWLVALVGILGYACLLVRQTPVPGYVAMLLLSLAGLLLPSLESLAGYLLALFLMSRSPRTQLGWWALAGSAIPISVNTYTGWTFHDDATWSFILINAGLWLVLMLGVWFAGRNLARQTHRLDTERLWAEDARAEATAMERLRISRDLHDSVAHSLTGIVLQIAGVRAAHTKNTDLKHLDEVLANVQTTAEQSMRELHRLLGLLRSADSEHADHGPRGINHVDSLLSSARSAGVEVNFSVSGDAVMVDPSIEHAVYRVIQEGLSNIMKHAGESPSATISVTWQDSALVVTVRSINGLLSNTPTTSTVSGGFGLLGLRERVTVAGGTLTSGPTQEGYLLKATLPIALSSSAGSSLTAGDE